MPNEEDVRRHLTSDFLDISNINLNEDNQLMLLDELIDMSKDFDFKRSKEDITDGRRYYYDNGFFGIGDGMFLNLFLRKFQPKKIVEIGCGFSSAMMLDTYEYFLKKPIDLTCIEPNMGDRLERLIKATDMESVKFMNSQLQDVPYRIITDNLDSGDFLFIDSTHIVKYGSDVLYEFNKLLPNLKSGVYVHFHDIAFPFDYPKEWMDEGRYWNEVYFMKQFLAYNDGWDILLWPNMFCNRHNEYMAKNYSSILKDCGGSLYLRKR